jgi:hypothetical protein
MILNTRKKASQMNQQLKVGIIGDYDPKTFFSHISTNEALSHAASALSVSTDFTWLPTLALTGQSIGTALKEFDALSAMRRSSSLIWRIKLPTQNAPAVPARMIVGNIFSSYAPVRPCSNNAKTSALH